MSLNPIYQQRINRVIDYINHNLDHQFTLDELANQAHFSSYHFHRIFVAVTGETVNFYTNRVRLEKAARLLKLSNYKITSVAMECGFSSSATFSRSFKQYFGISPSHYKNTGVIEDSKICKELFPFNEYLVPMSEEELQRSFPVSIKDLPQRNVAYIRVVNSYAEGVVQEAFEKMIQWAKNNDIYESEVIFGMSIDDPHTTPKEKYRYEVCLTLPEDFNIEPGEGIDQMSMPPCKYACTTISGDIKRVATGTDYLFNKWLISSSYEPDHQHGLEIFLDKENVCNWEHFDIELCIPIQSIQNI